MMIPLGSVHGAEVIGASAQKPRAPISRSSSLEATASNEWRTPAAPTRHQHGGRRGHDLAERGAAEDAAGVVEQACPRLGEDLRRRGRAVDALFGDRLARLKRRLRGAGAEQRQAQDRSKDPQHARSTAGGRRGFRL
jgi:hypothetical protein